MFWGSITCLLPSCNVHWNEGYNGHSWEINNLSSLVPIESYGHQITQGKLRPKFALFSQMRKVYVCIQEFEQNYEVLKVRFQSCKVWGVSTLKAFWFFWCQIFSQDDESCKTLTQILSLRVYTVWCGSLENLSSNFGFKLEFNVPWWWA